MTTIRTRILSVLCAALLTGCGGSSVELSDWDCGGNRTLVLALSGDWALVTVDGASWRLEEASSDSGDRYATQLRELLLQGGKARWSEQGKPPATCTRVKETEGYSRSFWRRMW